MVSGGTQTFVSMETWREPWGAVSKPFPGHWLQGATPDPLLGRTPCLRVLGCPGEEGGRPGVGWGSSLGKNGREPRVLQGQEKLRPKAREFVEGLSRQETGLKEMLAGWKVSVLNIGIFKFIVWLPLSRPLLGTWPTTQARALTRNQTGDSLVCRPALDPLSHTSWGKNWAGL